MLNEKLLEEAVIMIKSKAKYSTVAKAPAKVKAVVKSNEQRQCRSDKLSHELTPEMSLETIADLGYN